MPSLPISPADSPGQAILNGHVAQVRYLLELGHHPNERVADSRTPLILCALLRDRRWACSVSQTLLEKGGQVGLQDKCGLNAFHYACIYECDHLLNIYLKAIDFDLNQADKFGNTPLHYAARSGNITVTKILTEKLISFSMTIDHPNREGITPLMQAWMASKTEIAEYLIEQGADIQKKDAFMRPVSYYEWQGRQALRKHQHKDHVREMIKLMHFDDVTSWTKYQGEVKSARQKIHFKSWRDIQNDRKSAPVKIKDESALITVAQDVRNDANYVFKKSTTDLFECNRPGGQACASLAKSTARPVTAFASTTGPVDPEMSTGRKSATVIHWDNPNKGDEKCWKTQMGHIFQQYTFQCSPSFRSSCKLAITRCTDSPLPVFGTSPDGSESGSPTRGGLRRGSQFSGPASSSIQHQNRRARKDRKVSGSPQRLMSSDTGPSEDLSTATLVSSNGPPPSRSNKKVKIPRTTSRAVFNV